MRSQLPPNILFDLDGTLVDSLSGISFSIRHACQAVGFSVSEIDLHNLIGPPIRTIFSRIVHTDNSKVLDSLVHHFRISYDASGWKKTSCYPDVKKVLEIMKSAGYRLFIVSNKPRFASLQILRHEQLLDYFERIYTRDSRVPEYPSKEEMLREFLAEYKVSPSDCLMVGDTMEDADAAIANGIDTALVEHGYGNVSHDYATDFRFKGFSGFLPYLFMEDAK